MRILLIGTGPMAEEYARVLIALGVDFQVIGRGDVSARRFEERLGLKVFIGGVEKYLDQDNSTAGITHTIVATGVEKLAEVTLLLDKAGISQILVEKPAGINGKEVERLGRERTGANIIVAYNRRFFSSVAATRQIISEDGGVRSFHFEFTEWASDIEKIEKAKGVKEHWFLANSTHVVDLAFHLGGMPEQIASFVDGQLSWHTPAAFVGAGRTVTGALFSYSANWAAPGRWAVEVLTAKRRIYLKPMEKLSVQHLNSVQVAEVQIDDDIDRKFKPGLFRMVHTFLYDPGNPLLCHLDEHLRMIPFYSGIADYTSD